jgi:hypothetical protein
MAASFYSTTGVTGNSPLATSEESTETTENSAPSSFYSQAGRPSQNVNAIESSKVAAANSETNAANSATASASSAQQSANSAAQSNTAKVASEAAQAAAEAAETNAVSSSSTAASAAFNSSSSASTALGNANTATTAATNAASSATSASAAQTASETAQTASETAKTASEAAKVAAETAETNSAASAAAALASQNASSSSASSASSSSSSATSSAAAALTSENAAAASASSASTDAATATTQASNSATSATSASNSASSAASDASSASTSASNAASSLASFTGQYSTGASDPTANLDTGDIFFNTTDNQLRVYNGSSWQGGVVAGSATQSVDGLMSSSDKTKLDGVETGATSDQTDAEIKTAYENNTDTNAFTDALQTKLNGIEASADVTDTANVVSSLTAGDNITIAADGTVAAGGGEITVQDEGVDLATSATTLNFTGNGVVASGTGAAKTINITDTDTVYSNATTSADGLMSSTDKTKIDGIETGATADQTKADIDALGIAAATATTASNSTLLSNLSASQFLRSDQNDITSGKLTAADITVEGDLIVGKNTTSTVSEGAMFLENGQLYSTVEQTTANSGFAANFRRNDTDGSIIDFRSGAITIGSLGCFDNNLVIGNDDTGLKFIDFPREILPFDCGTGTNSDNQIDLGNATSRFRNLDLSGSITGVSAIYKHTADSILYLSGGTGISNGGNIRLYGGSHSTDPDAIVFRQGGVEKMKLESSNFLCGSDGGGDIGSSTKRWKDLYLSGKVVAEQIVDNVRSDTYIEFGGTSDEIDFYTSTEKRVTIGDDATSSSSGVLIVHSNAGDGQRFIHFKEGTTGRGGIGEREGDLFITSRFSGFRFDWFSTHITPGTTSGNSTDDVDSLGYSNARWKNIYATNSTIQTSDEREKQQIEPLTNAEIAAATAISKLFKTFKWNSSVASEGDGARIHTGAIAQEVATAMSDAGLDATKYAFWCEDAWWEAENEDGSIEVQSKPEMEAPEGAVQKNRKGIRYPELLCFIGAATEQRLSSIEARLDALEGN